MPTTSDTATPAAIGLVGAMSGVVPGASDARYAFGDRSTGNVSLTVGEPDPAARARLLSAVGLGPAAAVYAEQVHGGAVARVGRAHITRSHPPSTAVPDVDGLVTTDENVGLAVLVADCVPVLFAAPGVGVAAAHAGRRGVVAGVVSATVAALAEAGGVRPDAVAAVVGPAIGGCCYEVPDDLGREVATVVPAARATTSWGAGALDLPGAVEAQLRASGVATVTRVGGCTRCDAGRWFSHRATTRDGATPGRQAGIVCRSPSQPTTSGPVPPPRAGTGPSLH